MFDSVDELLSKIRLGEDSLIEFKSVRFKGSRPDLSRSDLADEIAAFANTASGVIVFGVDDKTKAIEGINIDHLDDVENFVSEIVNDVIKPSVFVRIIKMELPNISGDLVPILKVDIPRSLFVHKSPGGYYHRLGDKKRELSPEALARLFQQRSQARIIRFDEQPVPTTSLYDLDDELWHRFAGVQQESAETILEKLRFIAKDDTGIYRLTVSAVLMSTKNPEKYIPNAIIEAVLYRGTVRDSNNQDNAKTITGTLDQQVREAYSFVQQNMKVRAKKDPGHIDIPQYSMRAVFEALVNAVAHRDYSLHSSKIRLFMFDDRLELYSPGTIPNSMTIESMHLRQSTRNELISSLLNRCPVDLEHDSITRQYMMDKRGEGVPIILSLSEKLSGKKPAFQLVDDSEVVVTIFSS